jgi:hypothetical protein
MKTIEVIKIKQESLNKLIALGYSVKIVSATEKTSVFANYSYNRPISVRKAIKAPAKELEYSCLVCHKPGCECSTWHEKE